MPITIVVQKRPHGLFLTWSVSDETPATLDAETPEEALATALGVIAYAEDRRRGLVGEIHIETAERVHRVHDRSEAEAILRSALDVP